MLALFSLKINEDIANLASAEDELMPLELTHQIGGNRKH